MIWTEKYRGTRITPTVVVLQKSLRHNGFCAYAPMILKIANKLHNSKYILKGVVNMPKLR